MKFVCDRCKTRYSIADEKVRGKVLKVRCKTCSNIIVVRESTAALQLAALGNEAPSEAAASPGSAGAESSSTTSPSAGSPSAGSLSAGSASAGKPVSAASPPAGGADWWVAVKGQQVGPVKARDVERMFREGQVTPRTYAWHEGLPGWSRIRDLAEFAHLVAEGEARAVPPPPLPPADDAFGAAAGGQVVQLEAARAGRQSGATPASIAHDPFAAVAGPSAADQAPRESTRVFIMNAGLANRARKHKTYAAVAVAAFVGIVGLGYADWTGYIQIPFLHRALSYAAETAGVARPPSRKLLAAWDEGEVDAETQCRLMGINCPKPEAKAPVRRSAKSASGGVPDLDGAFGQGGDASSQIARSDGMGADIDMNALLGSDPSKASAVANVFANDRKKRAALNVKVETPSVSSGSGLDGAQISKVINDNLAAVKSCMESAAKQGSTVDGKQYLVVTISQRGTVPKARFKNGVTSASPVGECIIKAAKKWKFPVFAGEAFDVEIPLILSTSL